MMRCGGIDLGGTKIEARLFDGADGRDGGRAPRADAAHRLRGDGRGAGRSGALARGVGRDRPAHRAVAPRPRRPGDRRELRLQHPGHRAAPSAARCRGGRAAAAPSSTTAWPSPYSEAHGGAGEGARSVHGPDPRHRGRRRPLPRRPAAAPPRGPRGGGRASRPLGPRARPPRPAALALRLRHGPAASSSTSRAPGLANLAEWKLGRRRRGAPSWRRATTRRGRGAGDLGRHRRRLPRRDPDHARPGLHRPRRRAVEHGRVSRPRSPTASPGSGWATPACRAIVPARHGDSSGARGAALLARAAC